MPSLAFDRFESKVDDATPEPWFKRTIGVERVDTVPGLDKAILDHILSQRPVTGNQLCRAQCLSLVRSHQKLHPCYVALTQSLNCIDLAHQISLHLVYPRAPNLVGMVISLVGSATVHVTLFRIDPVLSYQHGMSRGVNSVIELRTSLLSALRLPGAWIYIPLITFLGGLAIWAVLAENDFSFYWRDPAAIVNTGPWIGLFSNIGNFLWWIAGIVCVFTALLLRSAPGQSTASAFLMSWGLLTGFLALDDFFMIHEWVIPTYLPLSEDVMFGVYFVIAVLLVVLFRDEFLRSPYPIFAFALACFAVSIVIDLAGPARFQEWGMPIRLVWNLEYVVEDGLKLLGIIAWLHYFTLVSYQALHPYVSASGNIATVPLPAKRRKRVKVR